MTWGARTLIVDSTPLTRTFGQAAPLASGTTIARATSPPGLYKLALAGARTVVNVAAPMPTPAPAGLVLKVGTAGALPGPATMPVISSLLNGVSSAPTCVQAYLTLPAGETGASALRVSACRSRLAVRPAATAAATSCSRAITLRE